MLVQDANGSSLYVHMCMNQAFEEEGKEVRAQNIAEGAW